MKNKKHRKLRGHFERYNSLLDLNFSWSSSDRWLYNEIYAYGPAGCWKSNKTLARQSGFCTRTIRRARQKLTHHMMIITSRTLPRTWSCWAVTHPAVKNCQILYFRGGQVDNPIYEPSGGTPSGGTKCPLRGDKMSPKPEQRNPPLRGGCSLGVSQSGTASGKGVITQGGDPPKTPQAVQGEKNKSHTSPGIDPSPRVKKREKNKEG